MPRLSDFGPYDISESERLAAVAIHNAACQLQEVLYYYGADALDLPDETKSVLFASYRSLRRAVLHYFSDHGLVYDPPPIGSPFKKANR